MQSSIDKLRDTHRKKRAALSKDILSENSARLCQRIAALEPFQQAVGVAAYIAIRGEADVSGLFETGAQSGKQFYLPVLHKESMHFAAWSPGQPLVEKGFGLLEPDVSVADCVDVRELDVVLTPLVVFDNRCNRIGQGGGYYDRTFAHKKRLPAASPLLIGVAHESQRESDLVPQSWDIPLDLIVTDCASYRKQVQQARY